MQRNTRRMIQHEVKSLSEIDTIPNSRSRVRPSCKIPEPLLQVLNKECEYSDMTNDAKNYYQILCGLSNLKSISEDKYWYMMKLLLYLEYYQCVIDMEKHNVHDITIKISENEGEKFLIPIPKLSENDDVLTVKTTVDIRHLDGTNHGRGEIVAVSKRHVAVKVYGEEFKKKFQPIHRYDIQFYFFDYEFRNSNVVLDKFYVQKTIPMLFPVEESSGTTSANKKIIKWFNESVKNNPEQRQAIQNILNKTAYPAPYILFGPPGTGKTSTLVECIRQILEFNPTSRILVCAPSNIAADEIAIRLLKSGMDEVFMYRMYCSRRKSEQIDQNIKNCSNFSDLRTVNTPKNVIQQKKIVITTFSTSMQLLKYKFRENYFSYLFCDETGQATELSTLLPFYLMKGNDSTGKSHFCGQIVLAGDPMQLGPVIMSRFAKSLGKSMLERLIESDLYKKIDGHYNPKYLTKLIENFRSHPTILHVPNKLFYDGELVAKSGVEIKCGEKWSKLKNKKFPIVFHAVSGNEERSSESYSTYNLTEVNVVVKYIKQLLHTKLGNKKVTVNDIGVITPYLLQKSKICKKLKDEHIEGIAVGTVEFFQGQEFDITIISTVRSKLYYSGGKVHIGHLSNPRRFNVALTRARYLLIVIGNPQILEHDIHWLEFIKYCMENNSCEGCEFKLGKPLVGSNLKKLIAPKHSCSTQKTIYPIELIEEDPVIESDCDDCDPNRRRRLPPNALNEPLHFQRNQLESLRNDMRRKQVELFYALNSNNNDNINRKNNC